MNKFRKALLVSAFVFAGIFCLQIIFCKCVYVNYVLAAEKININTASVEDLSTLSGIGEVKAQAIVDYRNLNGLFVLIEDIVKVSGIGTATFNKIKDSITVGEDVEGSFCGDGFIDNGEECDDGNNVDNDGCGSGCNIEQEDVFYSSGDIVINEFVSDPISGEEEWIELYSNFDEIINLEGWTIEEGGGSITNLSGEILPQGFVVFDDISGNLNNAGDIIILRGLNGEIIDQVSYGNWDDGNIEDNAPKADDPDSVARLTDGADTDVDNVDFVLSSNSTKAMSNNDEQESSGRDFVYQGGIPGSVVINEIVSDPEDGPEWIELYNKTGGEIDLSGWYIEEGSEAETILEGEIAGYGYFVIENPEGNLDNKGDVIFLFDDYGHVIDQVAYGDWDDGNVSDNSAKTVDPNGLGRIGNSQDTNNDLADFQIVFVLTKGAANILIGEEKEEEFFSDLKDKIIINEIFPNPVGSDEGEFIELKNMSDDEIDLSGILVGDNSERRYKINPPAGGEKIKAGEFFVILRRDSKIALNNTGGDRVILYDAENIIIDEMEYTEKAFEGKSYSLIDNVWQWNDLPSMGAVNILIKENQPPVAVIDLDKSDLFLGEGVILDCSDSYDPEGEDLILEWRLDAILYHGPILKLKFDEVGSYEVFLSLSDGEKKVVESRLVNVLERVGSVTSPNLPDIDFGGSTSNGEVEPPLINEFLPNPEGSDDGEFIELFNPNGFGINLNGLHIDDKEGGSRVYQISDGVILEPFGYFVFEREDTDIALNNTDDSVRLLDENKNVLAQVDYFDVVEGASFARAFGGEWFWTEIVTKGEENQIIFVGQSDLAVAEQETGLDFANVVELNQVGEIELGEKIVTRGIVTVEPGILGSQFFYISDFKTPQPPLSGGNIEDKSPQPPFAKGGNIENPFAKGGKFENPPTPFSDFSGQALVRGASADSPVVLGGIQVYSYKKDFPELNIGDEVEVFGVLGQSGGEHRLKIKNKDDIKVLGHYDNIELIKITADGIGEDAVGGLAMIEGEVIEITGSSVFVDDGSGEVRVYIKKMSGVSRSDLNEGDFVSVSGIVSETSSGYRLLPRFQDDIKKVETLGVELEESENSDIIIEPRDDDFLKYITATLGAVVLILLVVNFRVYRGK
jgi:competence ComEA-like helix-hairpin-helix protein